MIIKLRVLLRILVASCVAFCILGLNSLGSFIIKMCDILGKFSLFVIETIKTVFFTKFKFCKFIYQIEKIGVNSFAISVITGAFAGAVLTIQSYKGFKQFSGEQFIGSIAALAMIRELGPVLTGLMVTGRSGSAITAEIGTMQITEQIDALKTLSINVYQYLIVPRILAGTLILPFLALFAMASGILGSYIVAIYVLGLNTHEFTSSIKMLVELSDISGGMIKASVFGFILTAIGCYKGYYTQGGARGVGISTTQSVVVSSILIIISNYFLAVMLFGT